MNSKQLLSLLLFLSGLAAAQAQSEFASVDSLARSFRKDKYDTPDLLAQALCKNLKTEQEKARAIFRWVADNIRYDFKAIGREGPKGVSKKEFEEILVKQVYRKGRGVCMDYALLYRTMALAAGLECVFISGHSKESVRGGWASHAWNAVKIGGKWELLDPTWGAGHSDENGKFEEVFQPGYFCTPPHIFALSHFPDDEQWQLLDPPIDKIAFKNQPGFNYGDPLHGITNAEPLGFPTTTSADGKVELRLKIQQPPSVIKLKMGVREIPFEQSVKDGWLTLRFVPVTARELLVWGGEKSSKGVKAKLMGVFPVK